MGENYFMTTDNVILMLAMIQQQFGSFLLSIFFQN